MKRNRVLLCLLLLWLPAAPLALLNTGCETTRQEITYKTLRSTWETVHASMQAYADMRVAGKVSDADHVKVANLHAKYQATMGVAIAAGGLDWGDPPTADLQALAAQLVGLIATLRK